MGLQHGRKARQESSRTWIEMARSPFRMAMPNALVLFLFLAGCQSTQDVYLAQALDHMTAGEVEQSMGPPSHEQVFNTGQLLWLYRRESGGIGGRDFTPYCQDLWLTFDGERVLRKWMKQRC